MTQEYAHNIRVLFSREKLACRVKELGKKISADYADKELTIISISNGAMVFTGDLIREIRVPLRLDSITASSYIGEYSKGSVDVTGKLKLDVFNSEILLVDDILDTGRTLNRIKEFLFNLEPKSVRTCTLLDKPSRRVADINADYAGFVIEDLFVVGYGLDFNEYMRNLPYVGVMQ